MRYDVIIIGGGLSGLTAGIVLAKAGKQVAIVSTGQNSLHFNSGSFDLLGYDSEGNIIESPLEELEKLKENHPYSKIGIENIATLTEKAQALLTEAGIKTVGNAQRNHLRLTPVGMLKPTWITLEEYAIAENGNHYPWKEVDLVNIRGFLDFPTTFLAAGLRKAGVTCHLHSVGTVRTDNARKSPTEMRATNIAKLLCTDESIHELTTQLNNIYTKGEAILLPAVFGFNERETLSKLQSLSLKPLKVVATLPPSVAGVRTTIQLRKLFTHYGGTFLVGDSVISGQIENGTLVSVQTEKLQDEMLYASHFILSTGSFISHGLSSDYNRVFEPIFNLDVDAPMHRADWTEEYIFDAQPYMEFGVKTDNSFH
ncbi:MAG TPA: glycerol-3-phosphate dehydrogenase subunit GlpB, partial [Prevotella sp.]